MYKIEFLYYMYNLFCEYYYKYHYNVKNKILIVDALAYAHLIFLPEINTP